MGATSNPTGRTAKPTIIRWVRSTVRGGDDSVQRTADKGGFSSPAVANPTPCAPEKAARRLIGWAPPGEGAKEAQLVGPRLWIVHGRSGQSKKEAAGPGRRSRRPSHGDVHYNKSPFTSDRKQKPLCGSRQKYVLDPCPSEQVSTIVTANNDHERLHYAG
jgi:hypothetical protein